jgi:tRNA A37 threonylcarbamoyladenosine biosynthesis protein TsaE
MCPLLYYSKTCFARGFVRRLVGDKRMPVTSPTYLLDNTYEINNSDTL